MTTPSISGMTILYTPIIKIKTEAPKAPKESPAHGVLKVFMPPCINKRKHAILFGGPNGNFQYDIANMRDVLINRYAFGPDRIQILMDDGKPFIDKDMGISLRADYPATRENLDDILVSFGRGGTQELGKDDTLFIYIFSHGGRSDQTHFFATFSKDSEGHVKDRFYYDFELAGRISYIHCDQLIITLVACESDGFAGPVINAVSRSADSPEKTVFTAATLGKQLAWTLRFEESDFLESRHNVFSVFFYSALNENYPHNIWANLPGYAKNSEIFYDTDGDGRVSIRDAWKWADFMMRNHNITSLLGMELAGYAEFPKGAGETVFLGKPELMVREYSSRRCAYDIFFLDPAALAGGKHTIDDRTAMPESEFFWGNTYRAGQVNLVTAVVYNIGTAPCHKVEVEFRVKYIRDYYLVGTCYIDTIDTQDYAYAVVKWEAQSLLDFHKVENVTVRVTCKADPAPPFTFAGGEIVENRHLAQLKILRSRTENPLAPFNKIKQFEPVYPTFKRLNDEGYKIEQALMYSWVFKLVFNSPEFEGFAVGCLKGRVSIDGKPPGDGVTGWVKLKSYVDQVTDFRRDQTVEQTMPLERDGSYLFQLLPAGKYHVHVECQAGSEEKSVEIKKYAVSEENFSFKLKKIKG